MELIIFAYERTKEYFCYDCSQLRLAVGIELIKCGNCGSNNIITGELGSLDREELKGVCRLAKAKSVELNQEISAKLLAWKAKSEQLEQIKKEEFELRQWLVFNSDLFDKDKIEGSQTLNIGEGWKLTAAKVQNYTAINENGEALAALNLLGSATAGNRPDLAQSLVRWKPELSISTYRQVIGVAEQVPGLKEALAKAITIKQGAPQLKLIPPSEE